MEKEKSVEQGSGRVKMATNGNAQGKCMLTAQKKSYRYTVNVALAITGVLLAAALVWGVYSAVRGLWPSIWTEIEVRIPENTTVGNAEKSFQYVSRDFLTYSCLHSPAFGSLSSTPDADAATPKIRRDVRLANVEALPFSDRGIICRVSGTVLTLRETASSYTKFEEDFDRYIVIAMTGESEIVSEGFAKELMKSVTVKAMASNPSPPKMQP